MRLRQASIGTEVRKEAAGFNGRNDGSRKTLDDLFGNAAIRGIAVSCCALLWRCKCPAAARFLKSAIPDSLPDGR